MSDDYDPPGPNEPDASGSGGHSGGNININIPGLQDVAAGIRELTSNMQDLRTTMAQFGQDQHRLSQGVVGAFNNVSTSASTATESIKTFFQSMTGARPGQSSLATVLNYGLESGLGKDVALFPLRYMQSTIGQNRQFGLDVGGALASQQYATGIPTTSRGSGADTQYGLYRTLANTFGSGAPGIPQGTGAEIAQFLQIARQAGAMIDLQSLNAGTMSGGSALPGQNPRAGGFLRAASQIQTMMPSMPLGQIGANLGGYVANSAAQRQSVMLTGGAFSMIGQGGKMKSVTEWAEAILRWLENQRPGGKRGAGFTYEELLTQQYPGSNIDAWLEANGVPPEMREVWWNYALAKSRVRGSSADMGASPFVVSGGLPKGTPNPATSRLAATTPMTQTSFGLAAKLGSVYAQREDVNARFNAFLGQGIQDIIPQAVKSGGLAFTKYLPDSVEELLMSIIERTGILGTAVGGLVGWGGLLQSTDTGAGLIEALFDPAGVLFSGLLGNMPAGVMDDFKDWMAQFMQGIPGGDVGDADVGDWGAMGATTPSSLHPSMNSKVSAMMKANPRLKLNSGRRDEVTQRRLKKKGYSRVSGKSSAHTRGLAADMGPSSEYPWIIANAKKFGLQSGNSHGEPWHVGLPGIGDAASDIMGIGSLLGLFGGGADDISGTVMGSFGGLLNLLFGSAGSADAMAKATNEDIPYDPDFAKKMFDSQTYTSGGTYGTTADFWAKILAAAQTRAGNHATETTDNPTSSGSETLAGALAALGIPSTGLSDGAMVALLANKAGWTGTNLVASVAISKRESGFQPTAHRSDVDKALMRGDRGLWQINAGAWNDWLISEGYIKDPLDRAIFDPWVNAQAAHGIYARSNNFSAWTMGPNGWDPNGDPFYGTDRTEAEQYVREAGLATSIGDVDNAPASSHIAAMGGGGAMHFHNTFNLGSGGNSGMDTRRMVNMIADQLEGEMRRRMARSN